jgi:GAF domain-containing protein
LPRIHRSTARRPRVMADTDDSNNHWIEDSLSHVRELSNHVAELSTLMGISTLLSSEGPLPQALEAVCRLSAEICRAQVCFIHLADGDDDLVCVARHSPSDDLQSAWEGIARIYGRKAAQKGETVLCSNLLLGSEGKQEGRVSRMGAICAVPLKGKSRLVGAIGVGYAGTHRFSAREKDILNAVAAQVAVAVERSWLFDQLEDQLARQNSLRQVAIQIASNLDLDLVLDSIVNHASKLLAAEYSAIFLKDPGSENGDSPTGLGGERGELHCRTVQLADSPLERVVRQCMECGKPAIAQCKPEHTTHEPLDEGKSDEYRAALAVPLLSQRDVVGVLVFCYYERRRFDDSDISLAQDFAGQATVAIQNARLYQEAMENKLSLEAAINQITNHGISLMDEKLDIIFANPAAYWLLGLNPRKGKLPFDQWSLLVKKGLADESELSQLIERITLHPEETVGGKLVARGPGDLPKHLTFLSLPFRQSDGTIKGRVNLLEEDR